MPISTSHSDRSPLPDPSWPPTSTRQVESHPDKPANPRASRHASHGNVSIELEQDGMPATAGPPIETREQLIARVKREQRGSGHTWSTHTHAHDATPLPPTEIGRKAETDHLNSQAVDRQNTEQPSATAGWAVTEEAASIERPRSALHTGDFSRHGNERRGSVVSSGSSVYHPRSTGAQWLATSPPAPWLTQRPTTDEQPVQRLSLELPAASDTLWDPSPIPFSLRSRASSQSSLGFVFRAPTSPLANQSNVTDLDFRGSRRRSRSPEKASRRRTYSPASLSRLSRTASDTSHLHAPARPLPNLRREGTYPYQAHQPRRSVSSFSDIWSFGVAQTPSAHTRRPSLASESSPLQQLPMVGRYEESILRGRMSSLPSRPVEFVAQIGVLGKGDCKPSLKCPPHVTVPFPAVFYNYGGRPGLSSHEGPSPYVGRVDLEKHLKRDQKSKKRHAPKSMARRANAAGPMEIDDDELLGQQSRRRARTWCDDPQNLPQGTYRIPEQGQLQVVVKNPNKTAVKLFLIPYDLRGMQPGQKTWVRQRSYSAGPILDKAISCKPSVSSAKIEDPQERPMLRYLMHLHICCIGKGRYYLYKEIRIVFANRVPDGKEKLRQDISLPDPRFTTYRPERRDTRSDVCLEHEEASPMSKQSQEPTMETPVGSEISTGGRPNFAWESFAPTGGHASPFKSLPSRAFGVNATAEEVGVRDLEMFDVSPSSRNEGSKTVAFLDEVQRTKTPPPSNALFERLSREQWSTSGAPARSGSPSAGEGLIAQQYRTWSEQMGSSDAMPH